MNEQAMTATKERPMIEANDVTPISMMFDPVIAERVVAVAKTMALGKVTVPEHLRGNMGDCLAIVMQAASWRLNPYAVAQKTHLVRGVLGYEAQLVNAVATSLGVIEGRFRYARVGDWSKIAKAPRREKRNDSWITVPGWDEKDEEGLGVTVSATLRGEDEPFELTVYLVQAHPRNSTLWGVDPWQQLCYLAVKRFMRLYAPEAILGVYTADEIDERVIEGEVVREPSTHSAADLTAALRAKAEAKGQKPPSDATQEREAAGTAEPMEGALAEEGKPVTLHAPDPLASEEPTRKPRGKKAEPKQEPDQEPSQGDVFSGNVSSGGQVTNLLRGIENAKTTDELMEWRDVADKMTLPEALKKEIVVKIGIRIEELSDQGQPPF